ncbi:hypothetical protein J2R99_000408 [Rhodopseudomonas julia]|uniref:Transposase n=1 Tax=Rhodopseudomonas julia TaxID=200617 RepID=A0ABU0C226_9BRAD|nr:DUF6477 family protein [Rhodopseudomonas julia]MDQ0324559.1 hypothetical protein [Rhodopseudomonas julia]
MVDAQCLYDTQILDGTERPQGRQRRAASELARQVKAGADTYHRDNDLPRLIHRLPGELGKNETERAHAIVARLKCALRAERRKGRAGHWSYDLNRHIALKTALKVESDDLARLCKARTLKRKTPA